VSRLLRQQHDGEFLRLAFFRGVVPSLPSAHEPLLRVGVDLVRELEVTIAAALLAAVWRGMTPSPRVPQVQLRRDHLPDRCVLLCICGLILQIGQLQLRGVDDRDLGHVDRDDDALAEDRRVGVRELENWVALLFCSQHLFTFSLRFEVDI